MKLGKAFIFTKDHVAGPKIGTKGPISFDEWDIIKSAVDKYEVKTVLEFGAGFSTERFAALGLEVISMETNDVWAGKVQKRVPKAKIVVWDNKNMPNGIGTDFDLAFVDGVWPRIEQLRQAMQRSKRLFIHDVDRQDELDLIQGHLSGWKAFNWQNNPEFTKERLAFFEKSV